MRWKAVAIGLAATFLTCGCEKRCSVSFAPDGARKIAEAKKVAVTTDMTVTGSFAHVLLGGSLMQVGDDISSQLMNRGYRVVMVEEGKTNLDFAEWEKTSRASASAPSQKVRERHASVRDPTVRFERAAELGAQLLFEFSGACVSKTATRITVIPYVPVTWSDTKQYTKLESLRLRVSDVKTQEIIASIVVEYKDSTEHPGKAVEDVFQEFDRALATRPGIGQAESVRR